MLNKHNVLHKSLYTLHKNAQLSQSEPLKQLCNAIVVIVAGADDIPQCPDLGQSVGHHGGHTGPGQHGAVVVAVADGKGGLPGDAEPVCQGQQGGTLATPAAVTSTLSGDPCTASTPGRARKRGRAACAISALSKNIQNFSTS